MSVQSGNVLSHELDQVRTSCSVKGRAKSPRILLVSTKSKPIRFQGKDELLELFPGCHIRSRSKERRALPLGLDHPSFTVSSNIRSPLQQNLLRHHLPFGIRMSRGLNAWKLLSQAGVRVDADPRSICSKLTPNENVVLSFGIST